MDDRPGARSMGRRRIHPLMVAMVAASLATTGCQGMAATTENNGAQGSSRPDNTVADWPLKFVQHSFGAFCYSTYGCRVEYGGRLEKKDPEDELKLSSDSLGDKYPGNLGGDSLGFSNFPPPARVRWRSKDGTSHQADVDIGAIFKDQLIRHEVPREDVPEGVSIGNPEIVLEVNDRTINVYMRSFIPLKRLREPGNRHSDYRSDLVKVWSRTY